MAPIRRRRRPRTTPHEIGDEPIDRLCRLWALRIITRMPMFSRTNTPWYRLDDQTQELLDLDRLDLNHTPVQDLLKSARMQLKKSEREPIERTGTIFQNIAMLALSLDLDPETAEVLLFAAASNCKRVMQELFEVVGVKATSGVARLIAAACDIPERKAGLAIVPGSPLCSSGLLLRGPGEYDSSEHPLRLPAPIIRQLLEQHDSTDTLLCRCFARTKTATFSMADFDHLGDQLSIVYRYLQASLASRRPGANVLFYGPPGVGKTELARTIARAAEVSLYEVLVEDGDLTARSQRERIESLLLAQGMLKRRSDALLLFDEAEDLFPIEMHSLFGPVVKSRGDKGWVVRQLENNPVPTIWIANQIGQIDPAYLRRFDLCLEIKVPPEQARRRVLAGSFAGMPVRSEWVERMAAVESMTPADAAVAGRVLGCLGENEPERAERLAETVLQGNLAARGHSLMPPRNDLPQNDPIYNLHYLNTDVDINQVAEGLARRLKGAVMLYGPPGTGKTALAWFIGSLASKQVVARRGSDILSMWVGGTEQNIAAMFREATQKGAILLLDEADGFFSDRRGAQRPWEVTQVNELLVQMESFSGLFICSTNLIDRFDQASFRRFALKIRFDYLTYGQRIQLLEKHAKAMGLLGAGEEAEHDLWQDVLRPLDRLTPGDIVAVRKQHELIGGYRTIYDFACRVAQEVSMRPGARKGGLGFGG